MVVQIPPPESSERTQVSQIRSAYGPKKSVKFKCKGKSLTKQSFTEECDINKILAKYQKTGAIDHVNKHEPSYGYATSDDFTSAMEIVARGSTMFEELPSSIRTKFENDPAKFLEFVQDEKNIPEMQTMGLTKKRSNESVDPIIAEKITEGDDKTEPPGAAKSGSDDA